MKYQPIRQFLKTPTGVVTYLNIVCRSASLTLFTRACPLRGVIELQPYYTTLLRSVLCNVQLKLSFLAQTIKFLTQCLFHDKLILRRT